MSDSPARDRSARRAHVVLSVALVLSGAAEATNSPWGGDFWEHAAVVRELAAHPVAPRHPLLDLPTPHPLFTPYHLALALVVRATGTEPAAALGFAGVAILTLLSIAIWRFARWWVHDVAVAPWLLLFSLFLWGHAPWRWSGFLHFGILGKTAAYPSILGLSLAILALASSSRYVAMPRARHLWTAGALATSVVLVHPFSAPLLWAGAGAIAWQALRDAPRRAGAVVLAVAAGTVAALAWPYFSILGLVGASGVAYDAQQWPVYERFLERTLPILLALPLLAARLRSDRRDPTSITFAGLSALVFLGLVTGKYSLGRTLPGAILMAHTALADWTASRAVPWLASSFRRSRLRAATVSLGALVIVSAAAANFKDAWTLCIPRRVDALAPFDFLRRTVGPSDVVLTDFKTSAVVPAVRGRVVAVNNALPFVEDAALRRLDVIAFFLTQTPDVERVRILKRYRVRWVLLNHSTLRGPSGLEPWLRSRGRAIYEDSRFVLIDVGEVSEV